MKSPPLHSFGGRGPLLHFAHANGYPPHCYAQLFTHLQPHYQITAVEHRPLWPDAQLSDLQSWQDVADDMLDTLTAHGVTRVIGVGHSLGAVATFFAALKQPAMFSHLILIEPVFLPPRFLFFMRLMPHFLRRRIPVVQTALRRRDRWPSRTAAFDYLRAKRAFSQVPDAVLQDIVTYGMREDAEGVTLAYGKQWEARVYSLVPGRVWQQIGRIMQPTLALRGAKSDTLWDDAWARWQKVQPAADFVNMPAAGHLVPFEEPAAVAQAIHQFTTSRPGYLANETP